MSHANISQQQKHLSLIRLESGRQIWWLDNGISSHRAEVMLRRRMRYLQEEKIQHEVLGDSDYNEISAVHGTDAESQQNGYEDVGQHNNIISTATACDDSRDMFTTDEPTITAEQPSKVTNTALQKENAKKSAQHVANGYDCINAINEVSLESIDAQTILSHQLPQRSTQQLLQYCHESNIPVVTVGTKSSMCKKTWIDFGEDNINVVGAMSNRQFLIYATTESTTLDALDTTSSAMLVVDDNSSIVSSSESLVDVTLERMSTKGGFICMLPDNSLPTQCTGNNHVESASDPIHFQLKNGEAKMIHLAWNPIHEGCIRDTIGLRITSGAGQVRHEIVLVGSARESDNTTGDVDSSIVMAKQNEWNGVSAEYSEIREDGSQFDLVVDEVGLTITEESIECSSTATNGDETNVLIDSHEVHEIAQMIQKASISPKKASMAAKSLSQLSEARSEEAVNRRHVYADQIITAQEEVDSERIFAEETGLIPETSQDFVNGLYMNDKVRHLLDDFDAESTSTDDRRSGRSTPTFGSFSSEEEKFTVSDVSQRLYDEKQLKPQVKTAEVEMAAEKTETGDANDVVPIQSNSENRRFSTTTSYHYGKVTDQLNAMMEEDVTCASHSQSESDNESCLSSEEYDQSQDGKVGIFNFDKTMSNEENEELNMLPETSIDHSSDWDSSGTDMSVDSNLRRNQYKQIGSDLGDIMDKLSELEHFTQMQQDYLTSPTTHDFQTQLENINEQIDNNLTPSSGNATNSKAPAMNMSANRPVLKVKETREPKTANQPPTPKDSAQKCYFYKPPPKENNSSVLSASRDRIDQKKEPYKSPFAAVLEAETSFQSIDIMLDDFSSCDGSVCVDKSELGESNSSDDVLLDSSSFDESFSSKATGFDVSNHSSDLDDDSSTSMSEASSSVLLLNKETNVAASEPLCETRSEQIASIKSKLSSWKANANDQLSKPVVSRAPQYSSPTKIPQPPSTQKLQLKTPAVKSLAISSLETSVKPRQFSSPTKILRLTPSSQKLQLKTPALKTLDVASLTASASTTQKSARMTYGNFSQLSHTENSPSDNDVEGTSRLPKMLKSVKTPTPSRRAPTQLKTPSSISAYEKHVERMRRSRNSFS